MTQPRTSSDRVTPGRSWTPAQWFALVFGLVYAAVAVAGFVLTGFAGFSSPAHATLVVFAVNPLHNVIHAVLAAAALAGAVRPRAARVVDAALGIALGLVTVAGLLGWLGVLGMSGLADPDNFLHLSSAALALFFAGAGQPAAGGEPEGADGLGLSARP